MPFKSPKQRELVEAIMKNKAGAQAARPGLLAASPIKGVPNPVAPVARAAMVPNAPVIPQMPPTAPKMPARHMGGVPKMPGMPKRF
jgi:hypothetical protein